MTDLKQCVNNSEDMPEQTFDWGSITIFSDDTLSPGAAQTLGICRILPGKANPLHYHPNCEEVLYMLAGEGRHSFDDEVVELRPGSTIRIPIGVKHNLVNTGSETLVCPSLLTLGTAKAYFEVSPGGMLTVPLRVGRTAEISGDVALEAVAMGGNTVVSATTVAVPPDIELVDYQVQLAVDATPGDQCRLRLRATGMRDGYPAIAETTVEIQVVDAR